MCSYFDEIWTFWKFHGKVLIYDISYKVLISTNTFCIRFNQIDGFIRVYDGPRY